MIPIVSPPIPSSLWSPHHSAGARHDTQAIVIHATCGSEGPKAASVVAAMFADPLLLPARSAHEVIDSEHVVQCLFKMARGWHCGRTGNAVTYGIEICGQANQTAAQWHDETSIKTLALVAARVHVLSSIFNLPLTRLSAEDLRAGRPGICGHEDVSQAWKESDHTDPGPSFPWDEFLKACRGEQP